MKKLPSLFWICLAFFALLFAVKVFSNASKIQSEPLDPVVIADKRQESFESDEENLPLLFGNPSNAVKEISEKNNYLIEKKGYTLSYNASDLIPNWVSWHLCKSDLGESVRADNFRPDETLPVEWYAVKKADYQFKKYGFDRGHVCPSADRTFDSALNSETFYMTNMIPQAPDLNRNVWKDLESFERSLVLEGNEVYITAGPFGTGGSSSTGTWNEIPLLSNGEENGLSIKVPACCWKIILILDDGENDFSRVNENTSIIAVFMPNIQGIQLSGGWENFLVSVDYIEEKTGYDFFALLPDEIEDAIEAKVFER